VNQDDEEQKQGFSKEQIRQLKIHAYKAENDSCKNKICGICLSDFEDG
jgi:hypothetical protein